MRRNRKMWLAVIGLGVVLILAGVAWIIYSVAGTSTSYDASTGDYVSDSALPIVGFFVSFAGGTLISVGTLGWMFSWFSGEGDDTYTSTSAAYAQSVPTTRVGWGPDPAGIHPTRDEPRVQDPGFVTIVYRVCGGGVSRPR